MTIRATQDHIYVLPDKLPERSDGGIHIPETSRDEHGRGMFGGGDGYATGVVVAVGPGELTRKGKRIPVGCEVGDRVAFSGFGGREVEHEGKRLMVLDSAHVFGVVEA